MNRYAPGRRGERPGSLGEPSTPRICLLTETFFPVVGGGETHARLLASHLNLLGMTTFVLTRRTSPGLARSESVNGVRVIRVRPSGLGRLGKYAMIPFAMMALVRMRAAYDAIVVCGFRVLGAPAVLVARALGKTCVLRAEAEGEMSGGYASAFGKPFAPVGFIFRGWIALRNRVLRRADGFVSISRPVAQEYMRCGVSAVKIIHLPNGVDSEVFRPVDRPARGVLRERLGLPTHAVISAYSGKLNRGKGLEHLLKAWVSVIQSNPSAHLVLIGSGGGMTLSCEDELRRFARASGIEGRVTFTGYVHNVHEYLQAADLFVFPTEGEAFGLSLVEAMSCGLPVIASRVGAIPEIVTHGRDGILVEPANPDALATEIAFLMEEAPTAGSLGANARRRVCEAYSIESVASRYHQSLCALCRDGR